MKRPWIVGGVLNGVFFAILTEPMACPLCGRSAYAVANRDGVTRCLDCNGAEVSK